MYIQSEWGYKCYFSSFTSNARGVAVVFNNNFEFKINSTEKDDSGIFLIISFSSMDKDFILVNVYGPNKDDPLFYENLMNRIKRYNNSNVIIVGDFNIALDQDIDCYNYKQVNNPKARKAVEDMMLDLGLADVWRECNPDCRRYTWRRRSMITLTLQFKHDSKPNTFWKFNASLLRDREYIDEINSENLKTVNEYVDDNVNKYKTIEDILKSELKLKVSDKIFLDFFINEN